MNPKQARGADLTVDGTGLLCITLLLRLRAAIDTASPGTLVHVIATDPAAPLDLPAWCHMTQTPLPRASAQRRQAPVCTTGRCRRTTHPTRPAMAPPPHDDSAEQA
jgi:tRNA 2-thiouridine synthesizing protein A